MTSNTLLSSYRVDSKLVSATIKLQANVFTKSMACWVLSALLPTYYYSLPLWHIVVMAYLYWRSSRSFLLHLLLPASLLERHATTGILLYQRFFILVAIQSSCFPEHATLRCSHTPANCCGLFILGFSQSLGLSSSTGCTYLGRYCCMLVAALPPADFI